MPGQSIYSPPCKDCGKRTPGCHDDCLSPNERTALLLVADSLAAMRRPSTEEETE